MSGTTPQPGSGPAWGQSGGYGPDPGGYGPPPSGGDGPPPAGGYGPPPVGGYGSGPGGYPPAQGTYGPGGYGPGGPGGPAGPPPDYVYGGPGGQPPYQPPPRSSGLPRSTKAIVIAAVLAVLLGGGAFAFYSADPFHLFRSGPQAAEAIPANALFYAGLDLDPSAEQKVAALRFLNHFPAFRENSGLDDPNADVRSIFFSKAFDTLDCPGTTYDRDVKPWIGSKFGFAAMPPAEADSSPIVIGALEVTNAGAAKSGLTKIQACLGGSSDSTFGFAFVGDYALLAETQAQADRYAQSADSSSLADDGDFSADMESLGDLGVATMWANVSGAIDAFGQQLPTGGQLDFLKSTYQRAAATFRFTGDSAEIATSIYGDTPAVSHGDNQIMQLPDSTVFALSEAGGGARVDASWDKLTQAARSDGEDVDTQIAQFEAETGLQLPDDLSTIFGDNLLLAVDSNGLTADALRNSDFSSLDIGLRFTGDPAELNNLYDRVRTLIEDRTSQQLPVVKVDVEDGMALATNDDYAKTLAGMAGNLGDSPEFQSVTDDAVDKEAVMFFNWDSVEEQILQAVQDSGAPQEVIDNLRPLRALGVTWSVEGGYTVGTLRLSVND